MTRENRKIVKISKRKIQLTVVVIVVALIAWYGIAFSSRNSSPQIVDYDKSSGDGPNLSIAKPESVSISDGLRIMPPDNAISNQQISINDTREFLKTSYSASIKTRDVQGVVTSAKNIIKGNDGRVDNISSSEKRGYLTFVVPKSKFETFRSEIESLTHKKLFSETSLSQNLLGQKQSIEQQTSNIKKNLESLNEQKEALRLQHNQAVATINKELQSIRSQLSNIRKQIAETTDADVLNSLRSQESNYVSRENAQKQYLSRENSQYTAQNASLESQIKIQNTNLENVNTQDENFTENIETVEGRVDVKWISIWQMIKVFSPVSPEILVIVIIVIIWNILARLGYVPKFVWE